VLVIWAQKTICENFWTIKDKHQIHRMAYSLSVALTMDMETLKCQLRTEELRRALSDNLHQVKNPIQALRTFGKLLQRKLALEEQLLMQQTDNSNEWNIKANSNNGAIILSLAENIIAQSDRVVDLLLPMDGIVMALDQSHPPEKDTKYLNPHEETVRSENIEIGFVPDIIQPIISASKAIANERNIRFDYNIYDEDDLPGVSVDPNMLQEALSNVIDNSLKYVSHNNPSPYIQIQVQPNHQEKAGLIIFVKDNGIGIPKHERDKVFQRGYRSSNVDDIHGTGIGLAISRSMMKKMGGTLTIVDDDDCQSKGLVMKFELFR